MNGSVSVFNWSQSLRDLEGHENRISLLAKVSDLVRDLKEEGFDDQMIEFAIAAQITPEYLPSSDVSRTLLNMHLFNVDRGEYDLKLYIPELIVGMDEQEKELSLNVVKAVLSDLRKLFIRADELGKKEPVVEKVVDEKFPDGVSLGCKGPERKCRVCEEYDGKEKEGEGKEGKQV